MNRQYAAVAAVLLLAVSAMAVSGFTSPTEVEYAAHDTATEFENAQMLQNMKVENGNVTLGDGSTSHYEGFETDSDLSEWDVYYDDPSLLFQDGDPLRGSGDNGLTYRPGGQDWDNLLLYNDFYTDGETGTMVMSGLIYAHDFDDGTKPHGAFELVDKSTGRYYRLDLIDAAGTGDFRLGWSYGGAGENVNWLTGTFGDYNAGGPIRMIIKYDYSTNELTARVEGYDTWTRTVTTNRVPAPDSFGLTGASPGGSGTDYFQYDDFTFESGVPQSATYVSQEYSIDDPTAATVTIPELTSADATISVIDGDGTSLGSKTVSTSGTYTVSLDPSQQSDSTARVRVEVNGDGGGSVAFTMSREAIRFVDDPPDASNLNPTNGTTVYTNQPELSADISDPELSLAQGDSLTVEWYVDGTKVAERGPFTAAQTITYNVGAELAEGDHTFHVRVVDEYGGGYTANNRTFTVDHKPPRVDNSSADPSGGTQTAYASNTLTINVSDPDFARDGDTLTVGWFVDGTLVHETTGVDSNGSVSYTTSQLGKGTHNWYVKVGDSWGDIVTSDTFTYEIIHFPPDVAGPSIDGTTYYENNTLAVDVTDRDFPAQGDTVDVGIYVDGARVYSTTISSNQTVSYDAGPYADGDYTWHVEAADDYGYTTVSPDWWLNITHGEPAASDPSIDGVTHYENNTLAVDVTDADFSRDGDTVDVGFYINGTLNYTETISSNQTVGYTVGPFVDGDYTWHVELIDDYNNRVVGPDWTLHIQHAAPDVDLGSISPTGTIHYENANLTADISDRDFPRDGDTVDVWWYVDGTLVATETVASNGTVSHTTVALADGEHDWRLELFDDYGYVTSITNETFTVEHYPTQIDNSTAEPQGVISDQTPTFSIDITDRDFAIDGDSVDMGLYLNGTLIGVDTLYENGTAEVTPDDPVSGDKDYYWRAVGDYGHNTTSDSFFIDPPNSLYLYSVVRPYPRLNNTSSLSVITGSNETTDIDRVTDGSVEYGQIPKGERYVFSITADGYYQRGVFIRDLYSRNAVFLIPGNESVIVNTIRIRDSTGRFRENPILNIETVINTSKVPEMPDNGPQWVIVGGDRLGAASEYTAILRNGGRYRFSVENQQGDTRTVGYYTAKQDGLVVLEIGDIQYPAMNESGFTWTAYVNDTDGSGGAATFAYNDTAGLTENVTVTMRVRDTGRVIGQETVEAGTFGEVVITFPINDSTLNNREIVVDWDASRNGTTLDGKRIVSAKTYTQPVPLAALWLKVAYGAFILLLAFVSGAYLGPPGVFIVLGIGAGFGVLAGVAPVGLGLSAAVLSVALGATMKRWRSTQPQ